MGNRSTLALFALILSSGLIACDMQNINSFSQDAVRFSSNSNVLANANPAYKAAYAVIKNRCSGCHGEYLGYSEDDWVSEGYVLPTSPKGSLMYGRIRGSGVGGKEDMPNDGSTISATELAAITTWIKGMGFGSGPADSSQRMLAALDVFQRNCTSCHDNAQTAVSPIYSGATVQPFTLFATNQEFYLSGLIDITSTNPADSWIYQALRNYGSIGTMPKGTVNPISAADETIVRDWIVKYNDP